VETAYLIQGTIGGEAVLYQWIRSGKKFLLPEIDTLWKEVEWNWFTKVVNRLFTGTGRRIMVGR